MTIVVTRQWNVGRRWRSLGTAAAWSNTLTGAWTNTLTRSLSESENRNEQKYDEKKHLWTHHFFLSPGTLFFPKQLVDIQILLNRSAK
jgi:hypothetical protein